MFGLAASTKVILVAFYTAVVLHIYAYRAIGHVNPRLVEYARTLGAGPSRAFWRVSLPACIPELFGGLRTAFGSAWGLAAIAELLGALRGIGRVIIASWGVFDITIMMAGIIWLGIIAMLLDAGIVAIRNYVTRWSDNKVRSKPVSEKPLISIEAANCRFQHVSGREVQALDAVDLKIREGEFVCLLGRSGHGKSTLLRSLAGLNPLTSGVILVDDQPIDAPGPDRGMVFQEDTVFPWLSVYDNGAFGLRAQGRPKAEIDKIVHEWLDAVGLSDFAESWPKELSGGMRKRVAIASVFAGGAPILLMDEPFGALDYVTRMDLQQFLIELWQRTGRTIVFVTHDIEEALVLAERIIVMGSGRIVDDIAVELPRPRDEEVRATPRAVQITKTIIGHLGLGQRKAA